MDEETIEGEYDYIIVSAGSAGCELGDQVSVVGQER
jgi:choline dehydrogenase-like flavoprotein